MLLHVVISQKHVPNHVYRSTWPRVSVSFAEAITLSTTAEALSMPLVTCSIGRSRISSGVFFAPFLGCSVSQKLIEMLNLNSHTCGCIKSHDMNQFQGDSARSTKEINLTRVWSSLKYLNPSARTAYLPFVKTFTCMGGHTGSDIRSIALSKEAV